MLTQAFEHHSEALLPRPAFLRRLLWTATKGAAVLAGGLGLGICGYHYLEELPWLDALVEASMILGGMGPTHPLNYTAGKYFASFYALFSGILFLSTSALLLAPLLHRMLHRLHLASANRERSRSPRKQ
jgi:hypothetical protein